MSTLNVSSPKEKEKNSKDKNCVQKKERKKKAPIFLINPVKCKVKEMLILKVTSENIVKIHKWWLLQFCYFKINICCMSYFTGVMRQIGAFV